MINLTSTQILHLTPQGGRSRLPTVLAAGLSDEVNVGESPRWTADHFRLNQVQCFREATAEQRAATVERLSRELLEEALFIEQSGMAFASRMALLAETHEERMLYCLFASDEATHFHWVRSALGPEATAAAKPNAFHDLLVDIIGNQPRETMVYVIQVLLEGWGLEHYRRLLRGCTSPWFREALDQILKDESRHHGSGVVMCRERSLGAGDRQALLPILDRFFSMVRVGPRGVVQALEESLGGFSRDQRIKVYAQLESQLHTTNQLASLKRLMQQEGFEPLVDSLAAHHTFEPYPVEMCA